jgi:trehalose 6-phosphate phosphatase
MTHAWVAGAPVAALLDRVASARASALLLDFDGTLAPFRVDPASVRPWTGVRQLLERIQNTGRTTVTVVTGRPAFELAPLLGMARPPAVWGLHGAERLDATGRLERQSLDSEDWVVLAATLELLQFANLEQGIRIERKWNAVAVHWRGTSAERTHATRVRITELFQQIARIAGMHLTRFDGGVELHAGRDKGGAVRLILQSLAADMPVAYLGDDETDEYAFQALEGRGLGILVRHELRPSAAQAWLRPPRELRRFLAAWLRALVQGSWRAAGAASTGSFASESIDSRTVGSALG